MFNRADVPKSTLSIRGCEGFEHISILILTYIFKISRNQRHPRHFMAGSNRIKYSYVTVDRIEPNPFGRMEGWKDGPRWAVAPPVMGRVHLCGQGSGIVMGASSF